jgi:undecaprenyl-diphosphatase
MTFLQSIALGVLQGITEFLPVSSSGHLVLSRQLMELAEVPILFDVLLHVATLFVVLIVFRDRVGRIILALARTVIVRRNEEDRENLHLLAIIIVSTIFTGAIGYGIDSLEMMPGPKFVSIFFLVTAAILLATRPLQGTINYGTIGLKQGVWTGIGQGLGVLPGISRAGITISAALMSGMDREKAGEYSFLISIPAILGALMLKLGESEELLVAISPQVLAAGFISSFIVGLISLLILLRIVRRGKLYLFSIYLIPLGIAGLIFF